MQSILSVNCFKKIHDVIRNILEYTVQLSVGEVRKQCQSSGGFRATSHHHGYSFYPIVIFCSSWVFLLIIAAYVYFKWSE